MASAGTISFQLTGDTTQFQTALAKATQSMKSTEGKSQTFSSAMMGVFAGLGFGATQMAMSTIRAFKDSIAGFAEYEAAIDRAGAIAGLERGSDELRRMSNLAKELGATTRYTSTEVSSAYNFMAMAGMKANKIMASTPAVLQLASAGAIELGSAANIVTNIMAGFGKSSSELAQVNDILVSSITGANVDVSQLGEAFKMAGPVAKAAGISFEETATAISLMGNAGIQGTLAGTALRGAMSHLLSPTKRAKEILTELGVEATTSTGELRPLTDILADLEYGGLTAGEAMELFGVRAGPGMMALISQGTDAMYEFQERLDSAGGRAKQLADREMETLSGQFKLFSSATSNASLQLGEYMGPAIKVVGEAATKLVGVIVKLAKIWGTFISGLHDWAVLAKEANKFLYGQGDVNELKIAAKNTMNVYASTWDEIKTLWEEPQEVAPPKPKYDEWESIGLKTGEVFGDKVREGIEDGLAEVDLSAMVWDSMGDGEALKQMVEDQLLSEMRGRASRGLTAGPSGPSRSAVMGQRSQADKNLIEAMNLERQARIDSVDSVTQYTNQLGSGLQAAGNVAQGFAQGGFWGALAALGMEVLKETEIMEMLNESLEGSIAALAEFVDAFSPVIEALLKLVDQLNSAMVLGADKLGEAIDSIAGWFGAGGDDAAARAYAEAEARQKVTDALIAQRAAMAREADLDLSNKISQILGGMHGGLDALSPEARKLVEDQGTAAAQKLAEQVGMLELGIRPSEIQSGLSDEELLATLRGRLETINEALGEGSELLEDTVKDMNEELTNVPNGLKVALMRYNNATAAGGLGGDLGGGGSPAEMASKQFMVSNINVYGVNDLDTMLSEIDAANNAARRQAHGILPGGSGNGKAGGYTKPGRGP